MKTYKIGSQDISVELLNTPNGSRSTVIVKESDPDVYIQCKTEYVGTLPVEGVFYLKSQGRISEGKREKTRGYDNGRIAGPLDLDEAISLVEDHYKNMVNSLESGNVKAVFVNA